MEYDRFQIEQPMIEMISRTITSFQTQDVSELVFRNVSGRLTDLIMQIICVKCSLSKDDNLASTCHCGGGYRTSLNKSELRTKLKMIKSGELSERG